MAVLRYLLPAGVVLAGISLTMGAVAQTLIGSAPQPLIAQAVILAPAKVDVDHSGAVNITDAIIIVSYIGQQAEPCIRVVDVVHYGTPETSADAAGNAILVEGRSYLDETDPNYANALDGTPFARCQ